MIPERVVPSAVTPVSGPGLLSSVTAHAQGDGLSAFRERMLSYLDGDAAGTYTSFRRALAVCLREVAATTGGEAVLVPSFCSSDYPAAIEGIGLEIRRYDVDPNTLGADLDSLAESLEPDVAAVVAVNVLGYSSEMETLSAICEAHDTPLIEALGYGLGATYCGKRLGTFGDCSVLNFQQGKPVPVGGGMVVTRQPYHCTDEGRSPVEPNIATLTGYAALGRPGPYGLYQSAGKKLYRALSDGQPSTHPEPKERVEYAPPFRTMSNFQGALALDIFTRRDEHRRHRAAVARWYDREFESVPGVELLEPVEGLGNHQYVRYPVLVDADQREEIVAALRGAGIQAGGLYDWPPIDAEEHPGGSTLQHRLLALPTHPYVTKRDCERASQILKACTQASSAEQPPASVQQQSQSAQLKQGPNS